MTSPSSELFVHRANGDGTIDAICRDCYLTVATAEDEAGLAKGEREHVCDFHAVRRYGARPRRKADVEQLAIGRPLTG